jgi:WD40 repeat protein
MVALSLRAQSYNIQPWDFKTGASLGPPLKGDEQQVTTMALSPDGRRLVSSSADKTLLLCDTDGGQPILP